MRTRKKSKNNENKKKLKPGNEEWIKGENKDKKKIWKKN